MRRIRLGDPTHIFNICCFFLALGAPVKAADTQSMQGPSPSSAGAPLTRTAPLQQSDQHVGADLDPEQVNVANLGDVTKAEVSASIIKAEVLLDRAHASPGVIDGKTGQNLQNAIDAYETMHGLSVDGKLSQSLISSLDADKRPVIIKYTISQSDASYPFTPDIPNDYGQMAKMAALNFRTALEMFSERFHMDQSLLQVLNPGIDLMKVGATINVADVGSSPLSGVITRIDVDKIKGQVRAYAKNDTLLVAYPASVGSDDLPSPSGTHKVKGVARHPVYSYDPSKNFQQGANTKPLTIPAGPNNPVGSVYIALSKPTYGIHGTPDPSKIEKTSSHGCVRLPNWDAQELSAHVRPGVVVRFLGTKGA